MACAGLRLHTNFFEFSLSCADVSPSGFSDDHLGADLVESPPQLGALQLYLDLSVRPTVALLRLLFLAARVRVFSL